MKRTGYFDIVYRAGRKSIHFENIGERVPEEESLSALFKKIYAYHHGEDNLVRRAIEQGRILPN